MEAGFPPDPALPGAVDLLGAGGRAMVGRFVSDAGWSSGAIDPVQAFYRPGRSMTVRYDVKARYRDGAVELLTLGAECRAGDPVQVWAFPDDPALPGLPAALEHPEEGGGGQPELLRYRPRRRAVLRYRFRSGHVLFGKVLSPARAGRALAAACGLAPESLSGLRLALPTAGPAPGALLLAPLAGRPLRDLLLAGDPLPAPDRLARLAAAREAAHLTGHLLPELRPALDALVAAVAEGIDSDPPDRRPAHGDLYEAQVLVTDDARLGLIDLDDVQASLRWREAYALLLLTPSPFRTQHPTWPTKITTRAQAAAELLHGP